MIKRSRDLGLDPTGVLEDVRKSKTPTPEKYAIYCCKDCNAVLGL